MEINSMFSEIAGDAENTTDNVQETIQDMKGEYVWDWEDEFETLDEAYDEQGRGAAESTVLNKLIRDRFPNISVDDHSELFDMLLEHYELSVD